MLSLTQVRPYWLQVVREKYTFEKERNTLHYTSLITYKRAKIVINKQTNEGRIRQETDFI